MKWYSLILKLQGVSNPRPNCRDSTTLSKMMSVCYVNLKVLDAKCQFGKNFSFLCVPIQEKTMDR